MAGVTISDLANAFKDNYSSVITDAIVNFGPASKQLLPAQSLIGLLSLHGRIRVVSPEESDAGRYAKIWDVHSASGSATAYSANETYAAAAAETLNVAQLDWKRNHIKLSIDELARLLARGPNFVSGSGFSFEFMAKYRSLVSSIEKQLAGDGTGTSGKEITGFQAFLTDSNTSYAGINMTTSAYWQASELDGGAADLDTSMIDELMRNMDIKGCRPEAFACGTTQYQKLRNSLGTYAQYMPQASGSGEIMTSVLSYEGIPIYRINTLNDSTRANNEFWALSLSEIELLMLSQDAKDPGVESETDNQMGTPIGMKKIREDNDNNTIVLRNYAQLVCANPAKQGVIYNLKTTF